MRSTLSDIALSMILAASYRSCGPTFEQVMQTVEPPSTITQVEVRSTDTPAPSASPQPVLTERPTQRPSIVFNPSQFDYLGNATAIAPLTPPASSDEAALAHHLPDVGFIPAKVEAWPRYTIKVVDVEIPVPPEWLVIEWPVQTDGDHPVLYSASVMPQAYTDPAKYGYQPPQIGLAVFRYPVGPSLDKWLARYSSPEPFGSQGCDEARVWCGVTEVKEAVNGPFPGMQFRSEAMGISVYSVVMEIDDIVISLHFTHVGEIAFESIFDLMLSHLERR